VNECKPLPAMAGDVGRVTLTKPLVRVATLRGSSRATSRGAWAWRRAVRGWGEPLGPEAGPSAWPRRECEGNVCE